MLKIMTILSFCLDKGFVQVQKILRYEAIVLLLEVGYRDVLASKNIAKRIFVCCYMSVCLANMMY